MKQWERVVLAAALVAGAVALFAKSAGAAPGPTVKR